MEPILETKAASILQFVRGLRGSLHVTLEEGTCAAWLHDLLKPHVTQVLVCDPRKNAPLKVGNKSDRIDSRKLAELLRSNLLRSVYQSSATFAPAALRATYKIRGDCQTPRKSYKTYQTVGWVVGWEFLGKTALNATLRGQ
jgi:hypothetical protein